MTAEIGTLVAGVTAANGFLDSIFNRKEIKNNQKIAAINLLQKAINSTTIYLEQSGRNYIPNNELSQYWLDAFTAMIPIESGLARSLREKSRFWTNPQHWLQEKESMKLIPKLKELDEQCEMLLIKLQK